MLLGMESVELGQGWKLGRDVDCIALPCRQPPALRPQDLFRSMRVSREQRLGLSLSDAGSGQDTTAGS